MLQHLNEREEILDDITKKSEYDKKWKEKFERRMKESSPEVIRDAASKYGLSSVNASILNYVGNAITVNMGGVGKFNQSNPLYDSEIDSQFKDLMSRVRCAFCNVFEMETQQQI